MKDISFDGDNLSIGDVILNNDDNESVYNEDAFILKIDSANILGASLDKEYRILTDPKYKYNYSVDCNNDGINEAENLDNDYVCKYDKAGIYEVAINGAYPSRGFKIRILNSDNRKIVEIKQWGNIKWKSMEWAFYDAYNMTMSAKDIPDLSETNNTAGMFYGTKKFNQDISKWDVSNVVSMDSMFRYSVFNQDISKWDVSNVTSMHGMFEKNKFFNQDISNWDVSSLTRMSQMFYGSIFNQDISKWDVSSVVDMHGMFTSSVFNQDISNWDVSSVTA